MKPETKAIHIPAKRYEGSIAPPINLTTTFEHGPANELLHGYQYVRHGNPNVSDLETRLAALEGGRGARLSKSRAMRAYRAHTRVDTAGTDDSLLRPQRPPSGKT